MNVIRLISRCDRELRGVVDHLQKCLEVSESTFRDEEERVLALCDEAARQVVEARLQARADKHSEDLLVDGVPYRRHQPGTADYHSLVGPLNVERWTYRRVGERNGPTVVPLELEVGIMERATPALAYSVSEGYAEMPTRGYVRFMKSAHRHVPSRTTVERIAKRLAGKFKVALRRIEPWVRSSEKIPAEATAVVLGLDRTTVPMEEAHEVRTCCWRHKKRRVRERQARKPVTVRYRMAYVATMYLSDANGKELVAKRYAVCAHEGPDGVLYRMLADAHRAVKKRPDLEVLVLQDGAPELWNLMREVLRNDTVIGKWHEAIDWYHVSERLSAVLKVLVKDEDERETIRERWERSLLGDKYAISRICTWIDKQGESVKLSKSAKKEVQGHWWYLWGYRHMIRYAPLVELGLPIGSGVTEGACKSLITMRMKRSGQRWRPKGAEGALTLRACTQSDRLPRSWKHFEKQFRQPVQLAA